MTDFPDLSVEVRHSVKTGANFNIFFSDVDLLFLVDDNFANETIANFETKYQRLRKYFLFLGEVEIFRRSDYQKYLAAYSAHQTLFKLIRDIRKVSWFIGDLQAPRQTYHSYKSQRGIKITLQRNDIYSFENPYRSLGAKLAKFVLSTDLSHLSQQVNCDEIVCHHLAIRPLQDLGLSNQQGLVLLSVLPFSGCTQEHKAYLLSILKADFALKQIRRQYLIWEYYQIGAVYLANRNKFAWMDQWQKELCAQITELS